ncbi:ATP-dependent DNA helicase RecG [Acholeplasma granularum]|uniref:ATP-dependent DNA helicase RecG n=1 Tax=Acholeplasma granularum TaxID=264635 RepID=UPI000472CEEF|nr:DEAD/DEAH box helicase [Acholeplasma granularum]
MKKELIDVPLIGPKIVKYLNQQRIYSIYDLVNYLPKSYSDFRVKSFDSLNHLETATIIGKISKSLEVTHKKVHIIHTSILTSDLHEVNLTIFGRSYLTKQLKLGDEVIVKGKYNLFYNEINVDYISTNLKVPDIKPIYQMENISDPKFSNIIKNIFLNHLVEIYETLPTKLIKKHNLMDRKLALKTMHLPYDYNELNDAYNRFKYEEAFLHLLKYHLSLAPRKLRGPINYDINWVKLQIKKLPYNLTKDQKEATNDIFIDYKQNYSTYRLIQGDVGTGKTFVTFIAALGMISAGYQVAFLAPTEILVRQHHENFKNHFPDIKSELLTSSIKNKNDILKKLETGDTKIIFGTHILSSDQTIFNNLGLAIIDEQHKFGVDLRDNLIKKVITGDTIYLSATPIPRSLSLTFFGDLDVSNIKEKPRNTTPIKSYLLDDKKFDKVISILKDTQIKFEQSFIVVPAIMDAGIKHSIHSIFTKLEPFFNSADLYVIHGQLKFEEIESIMDDFMNNPKGILLSTTIIEVGIDVKNATTIIIMGAEYFGLSQLHQLRGRVGRGNKSGSCYFVSSKTDTERLKLLLEHHDGFNLSLYDLKLRGPGVFSSITQSGQFNFKYLDLKTDLKILQELIPDVKYYKKNIDKYTYLKKLISNIVI